MRYHKRQLTRLLTIACATVAVGAVLSAVSLGISGWLPELAFADIIERGDTPMLGVDAATAVPLGPKVEGHEKFADASGEETRPVLVSHEELVTGSAKAVAPVAVKAKPRKVAVAKKAATPAKPKASAKKSNGWRSARASWYGPGFYGNTMAGGGTLTPDSMVVAHRSLPFGTKIEFKYGGRTCVAVVQDRGPHIAGRVFDLGPGTARALGFGGVGTVQYRIVGR